MLIGFGGEKNLLIYVYDMLGLYIDLDVKIDICVGLLVLCQCWIEVCGDIEVFFGLLSQYGFECVVDLVMVELCFLGLYCNLCCVQVGKNVMQMYYVCQGIIMLEMEYIVICENQCCVEYIESLKLSGLNGVKFVVMMGCQYFGQVFGVVVFGVNVLVEIMLEFVCDEVVCGCVIILVNINYLEFELMIIGCNFFVKINVNIGNLVVMLLIGEEVDKMMWVICWGGDMVMDLLIGKYIYEMCEWIICNSLVLIGMVLIYQVFEKVNGKVEDFIWEIFCDMLIEQVE